VRVPTDDSYQLRVDAIEHAITSRTRAIVTISPNNPSGAVLSEASLRAVNALCRARGIYHIADEPYEYFHVRFRAPVSPGSFVDASVTRSRCIAVEGVRICRLAHRLRGVSGASRAGDDEEPGHDPDLPDDCRAGSRRRALDVGRVYCEPFVRELASIRDIVVSELGQLGPLATVPAADGAFYAAPRAHQHGGAPAGRTAHPRAQGGGDSRHGVRDDRRLLFPRGVRRVAESDGH